MKKRLKKIIYNCIIPKLYLVCISFLGFASSFFQNQPCILIFNKILFINPQAFSIPYSKSTHTRTPILKNNTQPYSSPKNYNQSNGRLQSLCNMQPLTTLILISALCIVAQLAPPTPTKNACSIFCSNGCKYNQFFSCNSCSSDFVHESSCDGNQCANCTVNTNLHDSDKYFDLKTQSTLSSNGDCGSFFNDTSNFTGIGGPYQKGDSIELFDTATFGDIEPHYQIKIMVSILFIDSSDKQRVTLNQVSSNSFSSFTKKYTKVNSHCNKSSGGFGGQQTQERVAYIQYGYFNHTDKTIKLNLTSNTDCGGGNFGRACQWMVLQAIILFKYCDVSCLKCFGTTNTSCTECGTDFWQSGYTCDYDCLSGFYQDTSNSPPNLCKKCNDTCQTCETDINNCLTCKGTRVLDRYSATVAYCPLKCPPKRFLDTILKQCKDCDPVCKLCTGFPSPCTKCQDNNFLYQFQCIPSCPAPLIQNKNDWRCQNCSNYCVNMTLSQYNPYVSSGLFPLMFDLNFTFPIDWNNFNFAIFQTISFGGSMYTTNNFNITYTNLTSKMYRITINPFKYAFIINQTVTIKVRARPDPNNLNYTSNDSRPFMDDVFNQTLTVNWTYIKPPNMTDLEVSIVSEFSTLTNSINRALTNPGAQEVKKLGFLLLVLNSLQITSCLILLNTILPENLYEGIRFFSSLIFFDVPAWQTESVASKYFIDVPLKSISRRRLQSEQVDVFVRSLQQIKLDEFTFRRTGFSGYFIYDAYWQIFLILIIYLILGLFLLLSKRWNKVAKYKRYIYSTIAAFHEISVMYFSITIVFEIVYFNGTKIKWVSIIICFLVNAYYLLYQLKVYHALLDYPTIPINDPKFEEFVIKYSYYLKWLRFDDQKNDNKKWVMFKLWFRPHNYHIQSYVKKFLMMLTFPLFYDYGYAQVIVLMVIQSFEIARFCFVWPYNTKWRNIYRLVLQCALLAIFALIFFIQIIVVRLTSGDVEKAQTYAMLFFSIGWVAFVLVYIFNIGFFVLFCINWFQNCNYTNRQILQNSRKKFYFNLLQQKDESNMLMEEWMIKGNLHGEKIKQLPEISYRVQYYNIQKAQDGNYIVDLKVVLNLEMQSTLNFQPMGNNIFQRNFIQRKIVVNPMSQLFNYIKQIYRSYAKQNTEFFIVKTFLQVDQSKYKCGQEIPLNSKRMFQQIQIHENNDLKPTVKKLSKLFAGFPISHHLLLKAISMTQDFREIEMF